MSYFSNCGNNRPVRILLDHGCNPCNPCSSCQRCSCECVCQTPDYMIEGCLTMTPSDCIIYKGTAIPEFNILPNDTLTQVIQKLANEGITLSSFQMKSPVVEDVKEENSYEDKLAEFDFKISFLEEKIEENKIVVNSKVNDITDLVLKSIPESKPFNFDAFIDIIKENPENISKFAQLISFINEPNSFVLAPHHVTGIPTSNSILVKWSDVADVISYTVYYKEYNSSDFIKVGETPARGLTIPNLKDETEYEIYVIATGINGMESAPTKPIRITTNSK